MNTTLSSATATPDEQGYDTQVIFRRGKNRFPARDADGFFGLRYERGEKGWIVESWSPAT